VGDETQDDDISYQYVQAPSSPDERLVDGRSLRGTTDEVVNGGEIRLTYGELKALIEDAVKALK